MHLFWLKFQPRHFFSWKTWLVRKLWSSEVHDWIPGITTLRLTGYCSPYNHLITVIELPLSHTFEYAIQNRHSNCFTCYRKLGYNGTVRRASVQPLVGRTTPCSFLQRTPTPKQNRSLCLRSPEIEEWVVWLICYNLLKFFNFLGTRTFCMQYLLKP